MFFRTVPIETEEDTELDSKEKDALLTNAEASANETLPAVKVVPKKNEVGQSAGGHEAGNDASPSGVCARKKTSLEDACKNVSRIFTPFMFEGERAHSLMIPQFANPDLEIQYRLSYFRAETFRLVTSSVIRSSSLIIGRILDNFARKYFWPF